MWDQFAGWGEESVWGTPVARTQFSRVFEDSAATPSHPFRAMGTLGDRDMLERFDQPISGGVTLAVPLVYDGDGKLLKHCMGTVVDAGSGPYTHTHTLDERPYTRSSSPLIGLTAELAYQLDESGFESAIVAGCRVVSFGLSFAPDEEVKLTAECAAKSVVLGAVTGAPTFPDYDDATAPMLVKPSQLTIAIDGSGSAVVDKIDLSCANTLRTDRTFLGSAYVADARVNGRRVITGTLEKRYIDKTLWNKWLSGAAATLKITATGPGNHVMVFDLLGKIYFTGDPLALEAGEEQNVTLPFQAWKSDSEPALKITETNDTATT